LGMIPPYGYNSRKITTGQPYSRAILISMSCAPTSRRTFHSYPAYEMF
jgi:hypothetical protein